MAEARLSSLGKRLHPWWISLISIVAVPLCALLLQWAFVDFIKRFSFFFFFLAIFISTYIGTKRDGIISTVISATLAWYYFVPPEEMFFKGHLFLFIPLALFVACGICLAFINDQLKSSLRRISTLNDELSLAHNTLLDSMGDGVFVAQDGRFAFCNKAMAAMLGYDEQEFSGLNFDQVIAPPFQPLWEDRLNLLTSPSTDPARQCPAQLLCKSGRPIWVELHANRCIYHANPALLGIVRDISERRRHEDHMRLSATVLESVQEAIAVTDLNGTIITANPAFTRVTEYTLPELAGQNMNILHSGRQSRDFYQQMWGAILTHGSWQGAIWNRRKSGEIYKEWLVISTVRDDSGNPLNYVAVSLDISRAHHVETDFEHMAHHDALTNLPNRALLYLRFQHTLERAKRDRVMCAALFLDLDGFKAVNDTLGHSAGDQVLQQAAVRMHTRIRETDTLARMGGDEFVVVMEGISGAEYAEHLATALIAELVKPFHLDSGTQVQIGCSIGIALFPTHGDAVEQLIDSADAALYAAKRAGKGIWQFHSCEHETAR